MKNEEKNNKKKPGFNPGFHKEKIYFI